MTLDDYKLYTGQTINLTQQDFDVLLDIAKKRLARFLCLEAFPELNDTNKDLALLLANFLAGVIEFAGVPEIVNSKSIRNFTISFSKHATNAFGNLWREYRDIIDDYSECGPTLKVECDALYDKRGCCCGD